MSLPTYITDHKADAVRSTFMCVELDFAVVQRLTECPFPVAISGNTFTPAVLKVEGVRSVDSDPAATAGALTIGSGEGNYWQDLLAELGGVERHPVIGLYEVWVDPAGVSAEVLSSRLVVTGRLESAEWDTLEARITLGPVSDPATSRLPFREATEKCSIRKYKGLQCLAGTGAPSSCDRAYATCASAAYNNAANFGGLRYPMTDTVTLVYSWYGSDGVDHWTEITLRKRAA